MNNGKGIPIEVHKEHKVHIPSMIFGEMMTSSNYDDNEKKVTGGRNGFGAKLCNIFSQSFTGTNNRFWEKRSHREIVSGIRLKSNYRMIILKKSKLPLVERNSNRHGLVI